MGTLNPKCIQVEPIRTPYPHVKLAERQPPDTASSHSYSGCMRVHSYRIITRAHLGDLVLQLTPALLAAGILIHYAPGRVSLPPAHTHNAATDRLLTGCAYTTCTESNVLIDNKLNHTLLRISDHHCRRRQALCSSQALSQPLKICNLLAVLPDPRRVSSLLCHTGGRQVQMTADGCGQHACD